MKYDRFVDTLNLILDEHLSRMAVVTKMITFPDTLDPAVRYDNVSLGGLMQNKRMREHLHHDEDLLRLNEIKDALATLSLKLLQEAKAQELSFEDYAEFQNLGNAFISRLHRFEQELTREGSGVDPLTGLRSQSVLTYDLTRELSACERRGDYLGLAIGRIDNFDQYKTNLLKENIHDILIFTSDVIKKNMRLYDDAYRYKDDMFVMVLKHTDRLGAVSATERLVKMLRDAHETPIGQQLESLLKQKVSMSYSISKLEVGANIHDFLAALENDVKNNTGQEKSTILEYDDVSALERFAKDMEEGA